MKRKIGSSILAGAMIVSMVIPVTAVAGQRSGNAKKRAVRNSIGTKYQIRTQDRLRDGSCIADKDGTQLKTLERDRDRDRDRLRDGSGKTQ
jgi:hypothetical protein